VIFTNLIIETGSGQEIVRKQIQKKCQMVTMKFQRVMRLRSHGTKKHEKSLLVNLNEEKKKKPQAEELETSRKKIRITGNEY